MSPQSFDWDKELERIVERAERKYTPSHPLVDEDNLKSFRPLEELKQGAIIELGYAPEEKKNWGRVFLISTAIVLFVCFAFFMLLVPVIFPIMDFLGIDVK